MIERDTPETPIQVKIIIFLIVFIFRLIMFNEISYLINLELQDLISNGMRVYKKVHKSPGNNKNKAVKIIVFRRRSKIQILRII